MNDFSSAPELAVVAELARQADGALVIELPGSARGILRRDDQSIEVIDSERYQANPNRKTGSVALLDQGGLIGYVNRHRIEGTTLWGELTDASARIVAVLDDHDAVADGNLAGWGQHRASLTLQPTKDWLHWIGQDGKWLDQATFAEHLEDGVDCIASENPGEPTSAELLEVAKTFHATRDLNFRSGVRLDSGEVQFCHDESIQSRAGRSGDIVVPETFKLGLAPFEGSDLYKLTARFRYRLNDGSLKLGYRLVRPDRTRQSAFNDAMEAVAEGTGLPVFAGSPRG